MGNITTESTVRNATETINYYNPDGGCTVKGEKLQSGDGGRVRNIKVNGVSHSGMRNEAWNRGFSREIKGIIDGINLYNNEKK